MRYSPYYKKNGAILVKDVASIANCSFEPDYGVSDRLIRGTADLDTATDDDISFVVNAAYLNALKTTRAGACILRPEYLAHKPTHTIALISENPQAAYARLQGYFHTPHCKDAFISERAVIAQSAHLGEKVTVSYHAVIAACATIGNNTHIGAGSYIGRGVTIGKDCYIGHNVVIEHTVTGDECIIHSGTQIGQDGFGFATERGQHIKIPQLGKVIIGSDVEIGSGCCIDRGVGPDTIIGDGCKLDNMVQIAHNVVLGNGCLIAGQSGIAGSTMLGDYVSVGGQTAISGHLRIGNGVQIAGKSGVTKNVPDYQKIGGCPAVPIQQWHRQSVFLKRNTKK